MANADIGPIAVIDVETTGLFPSRADRVVEIAAVVVHAGEIEREFASLVNPSRDIGPTSIHGLTSEHLISAPRFEEIAAPLIESLRGVVAIAGHNIRFDHQFLQAEFARMGHPIPRCFTICTMEMAGGGKLQECCDDYEIPFHGDCHHAMDDARAASRLLAMLLPDSPKTLTSLAGLPPIEWPTIRAISKPPVTRLQSELRRSEPPTYLQRLLCKARDATMATATDGAVMAYEALLDRVLEDRWVDEAEGEALIETASRWHLSADQIRRAHHDYLYHLALAAVADGIVTAEEHKDLNSVARLLGADLGNLDSLLNEAAELVSQTPIARPACAASDLSGQLVCFTGESRSRCQGQLISRERAEELATKAGLQVLSSVTKKLDLLVVADAVTQSGKAEKARKYGVRIMHESVFWKAIGVVTD